MRNFVPVRIMEFARRREITAAAALLLGGAMIWFAARGPAPEVRENSLDSMRFGDLRTEVDKAGRTPHAAGQARTSRRMPTASDTEAAAAPQPTMTAWMLSNAALDLNGEFVPPPIQVALSRSTKSEELSPPRRAVNEPSERVIQQLQMESDPSVPKAQFTGVTLDGEEPGR
jgi:hypothetical protein